MPMEGSQALACPRIPQLYFVIFRPGDQETFGGMPINSFGVPIMTFKDRLLHSFGEIEDLNY